MYSHSVSLNMIYVYVYGPLTRFNWLFELKSEKKKSWCFWGFAHCLFLSLKPSVGNRFPACPFFYFCALLSRFSSVSALSIPCLFKALYFLGCDTAAQRILQSSFPTPSAFRLFLKVQPLISLAFALLSGRSRFCWFLCRIDGKTGVMDPFLKKEKKG